MNYPEDFINKIICGDCIEILKLIPEGVINLVLTDPPYGLGKSNLKWEGRSYKRISEDWDLETRVDWLELTDAPSILSFCGWGCIEKFLDEGNRLGLKRNAVIVWDKVNPVPNITARGYQFSYEFVIWWTRGTNWTWNTEKQQMDILRLTWSEANSQRVHPAQKPVKLLENLILRHSNLGDVVLDPFIGSGSTAVACKNLGRKYIGIDTSTKYCEIANQRLAQEILPL